MMPLLQRPDNLEGATYQIKTPLSDDALYVTINDIIINDRRRPFELFINSKNMENFEWVVALTRVISTFFRFGGDATLMVDELKSISDARGGYFKKGGARMPSVVAEIGETLEKHLIKIGMIDSQDESRRPA
jgi:hypothetical protein